MSLREKVESILMDNIYTCEAGRTPSSIADQILALIAGQRCQWEKDGDGDWDTECGCCYDGEHWFEPVNAFCPCCGRKIEVKGE